MQDLAWVLRICAKYLKFTLFLIKRIPPPPIQLLMEDLGNLELRLPRIPQKENWSGLWIWVCQNTLHPTTENEKLVRTALQWILQWKFTYLQLCKGVHYPPSLSTVNIHLPETVHQSPSSTIRVHITVYIRCSIADLCFHCVNSTFGFVRIKSVSDFLTWYWQTCNCRENKELETWSKT